MAQGANSQVYHITPQKQLIEINGDIVSFECTFSITSLNSGPFQACVASQSMIDTMENLPFQNSINGVIQGDILHNTGEHEAYYLVVRANPAVTVEVTLQVNKVQHPLLQFWETWYTHIRIIAGTIMFLLALWLMYRMWKTHTPVPSTPSTRPDAPPIPRASLLNSLRNTIQDV